MRPAMLLLVVLVSIATLLHVSGWPSSRPSTTTTLRPVIMNQTEQPLAAPQRIDTTANKFTDVGPFAWAQSIGSPFIASNKDVLQEDFINGSSRVSPEQQVFDDQISASHAAAFMRVDASLLPQMLPAALSAVGDVNPSVKFTALLCIEWALLSELSVCRFTTQQGGAHSTSSACRDQRSDDTNRDCQELDRAMTQHCATMLIGSLFSSRRDEQSGLRLVVSQYSSQRLSSDAQAASRAQGMDSSNHHQLDHSISFGSSVCSPTLKSVSTANNETVSTTIARQIGKQQQEHLLLTVVDVRLAQLHLNALTRDRRSASSPSLFSDSRTDDIMFGLLCMEPKVRASISFAVSNSWMFRSARSHMMWSLDDVIDRKHPKQPDDGPALAASFTFNFANKHASSRSSARAKAVYFNMTNIIVPTFRGGPSQTIQGLGIGGKKKLDRIRDERFINIRKLYVSQREATLPAPRFMIRKRRPLYLFPMIFGSDNVGHVMFRYYSVWDLFKNEWFMDPIEDVSRIVDDGEEEEGVSPVVGYVVMPSAETTFRERSNMHRIFYDAMSPRWFSVMSSGGRGRITNPSSKLHSIDVVFEKAFVGFGRTYMFHPRHIGDLDRVRKESQLALVPALEGLRRRLLECFGWWHTTNASLYSEGNTTQSSRANDASGDVIISVILRNTRRLVGIESHIKLFLGNMTQSLELTSALRGRRGVTIHLLRPETLTIREQVAAAMRSDVWFGAAGTGLSWMMFMKPTSTVVEVQDPPIMRCTGPGVNTERTYCDFSKQSAAARLHHIGVPVPKYDVEHCKQNALKCDLNMSYSVFRGAMLAAICTVGIPDEDQARDACSRFLSDH